MRDDTQWDYSAYPEDEATANRSFELLLELLVDHDQIVASVVGEFSSLYAMLCKRRAAIDQGDPSSQVDAEDYACDYNRSTLIIEGVLCGCLVILQTEIARVATLVCGDLNCQTSDVRCLDSSTFRGTSRIELIWSLSNYLKHRDEWPRSKTELDQRQRRQYDTLFGVGEGCPLQMQPGFAETLARAAFGCSEESGLGPILNCVEEWKTQLAKRLRLTAQ